jgi:hypothetical protein
VALDDRAGPDEVITHLVLPDPDNDPPLGGQRRVGAPVAIHVPR